MRLHEARQGREYPRPHLVSRHPRRQRRRERQVEPGLDLTQREPFDDRVERQREGGDEDRAGDAVELSGACAPLVPGHALPKEPDTNRDGPREDEPRDEMQDAERIERQALDQRG